MSDSRRKCYSNTMKPNPFAARLLLAWTILLAGLIGFWFFRPWFDALTWLNLQILSIFVSSKIAMLIVLDPALRKQLTLARLIAYLLWPGMEPKLFAPGRSIPSPELSPQWTGCIANLLTGSAMTWLLPLAFPQDTPVLLRAWVGLIGLFFFVAFGLTDLWVLLYQKMGIAVEKLWLNPAAATGLAEFWGKRWNRVYSGMLREIAFVPLMRRIGTKWAMFAVFIYSGVLHEIASVAAASGYGGPFLYFMVQAIAFRMEETAWGRRKLRGHPFAGRCWTFLIVVGPLPLLVQPEFLLRAMAPMLVFFRVPGLDS
ncbi:MAG TPA: MBOAT family protein [Gemmataceae bacterium]|nr:MBOAT family protein [Gemmataceae bacterium]